LQSKAFVITVCLVNLVMLALQYYWGSLIAKALYKLATGDPSHKDA